MSRTAAVVVAAGTGRRFGGAKQYALLGGRPLYEWSLAAFEAHPAVDDLVLVLPEADTAGRSVDRTRFSKLWAVVAGGERRQDSVALGFARLDPERTGLVLVHDGARPLVSAEVIARVAAAASTFGAAAPVVPTEDTIKDIVSGTILGTLDRSRLGRAQTPQGFAFGVLSRALEKAREDGFSGTDEASLVERLGGTVAAVEGDPRNLKVTTPLDLVLAEAILDENRHRI